jgi:MinD-like ATPase involved in chromosome partitioning or flagellar assembly
MAMLALASIKGSPGVTTTALALAAASPEGSEAIVAELDPSGGDVAARFSRPFEPGLISLAAAARRPGEEARLAEHCQEILGNIVVLVGPAAGERAEAAMRLLSERSAWHELQGNDTLVLADCGRLDGRSIALAIVEASSALIVVCRPILSELQHVHARLPWLRRIAGHVRLILIGDGPYSETEVSASLEIDVLGTLPADTNAARMLRGEPGSRRALSRLPLLRSATALTREITSALVSADGGHLLIEAVASRGGDAASAVAAEAVP